MDISIALSLIALAVSAGGLAVSLWATRISKRSLEHSQGVQKEAERREFDAVRADLLNQIADGRAVLDRTRIEIGTLRANFLAEPATVQALMVNFTGLFSEFLPKVELGIRQADELWAQVAQWDSTKSHKELMDAIAVLYRSLQDDKAAQESGMYLVNRFTVHLESARQRALEATMRPEEPRHPHDQLTA